MGSTEAISISSEMVVVDDISHLGTVFAHAPFKWRGEEQTK
jgi:hypothetical protein